MKLSAESLFAHIAQTAVYFSSSFKMVVKIDEFLLEGFSFFGEPIFLPFILPLDVLLDLLLVVTIAII